MRKAPLLRWTMKSSSLGFTPACQCQGLDPCVPMTTSSRESATGHGQGLHGEHCKVATPAKIHFVSSFPGWPLHCEAGTKQLIRVVSQMSMGSGNAPSKATGSATGSRVLYHMLRNAQLLHQKLGLKAIQYAVCNSEGRVQVQAWSPSSSVRKPQRHLL